MGTSINYIYIINSLPARGDLAFLVPPPVVSLGFRLVLVSAEYCCFLFLVVLACQCFPEFVTRCYLLCHLTVANVVSAPFLFFSLC